MSYYFGETSVDRARLALADAYTGPDGRWVGWLWGSTALTMYIGLVSLNWFGFFVFVCLGAFEARAEMLRRNKRRRSGGIIKVLKVSPSGLAMTILYSLLERLRERQRPSEGLLRNWIINSQHLIPTLKTELEAPRQVKDETFESHIPSVYNRIYQLEDEWLRLLGGDTVSGQVRQCELFQWSLKAWGLHKALRPVNNILCTTPPVIPVEKPLCSDKAFAWAKARTNEKVHAERVKEAVRNLIQNLNLHV
jgi:hypothetical protein